MRLFGFLFCSQPVFYLFKSFRICSIYRNPATVLNVSKVWKQGHRQPGGRPCGRAAQPAHRTDLQYPFFLRRPMTWRFHNSLVINLLPEIHIIDTLLGKGYQRCADFINCCKSTSYKTSLQSVTTKRQRCRQIRQAGSSKQAARAAPEGPLRLLRATRAEIANGEFLCQGKPSSQ